MLRMFNIRVLVRALGIATTLVSVGCATPPQERQNDGFKPGGAPPVAFHCEPGCSLTTARDDAWEIGLFDAASQPVPFQLRREKDTQVMSFRPDEKAFVDGRIGDYVLAFKLGPGGKPGVLYDVGIQIDSD